MRHFRLMFMSLLLITLSVSGCDLIEETLFGGGDEPSITIAPSTLSRYDGLRQGVDENGLPMLGVADAPVQIQIFSSFGCPPCRFFSEDNMDTIIDAARAGELSYIYVPMQTGGIPNVVGANAAAMCASEQGAFFQFHDALFYFAQRYGNDAFTESRFRAAANDLMLDMDMFESCLDEGRFNDPIDNAIQLAVDLNISATPTLVSGDTQVVASESELMSILTRAGGG